MLWVVPPMSNLHFTKEKCKFMFLDSLLNVFSPPWHWAGRSHGMAVHQRSHHWNRLRLDGRARQLVRHCQHRLCSARWHIVRWDVAQLDITCWWWRWRWRCGQRLWSLRKSQKMTPGHENSRAKRPSKTFPEQTSTTKEQVKNIKIEPATLPTFVPTLNILYLKTNPGPGPPQPHPANPAGSG